MGDNVIEADLIAVLVAVTNAEPRVLTLADGFSLPSGPLRTGHKSLQAGLRAWVEQQTHHPLGYVEQLYTFADQRADAARSISISYLGLSREEAAKYPGALWRSWYDYFPWEDTRNGTPCRAFLLDCLGKWAGNSAVRKARIAGLFGAGPEWNDELVLQRYELLWEVGIVAEARRDRVVAGPTVPGREMTHDHRRILATAIARLRAKIKYRPVVFELLPREFTLLELQQAMEALAGVNFHKPNFRRFIEQQDLVEETGHFSSGLAGRPAKLFRFRAAVMDERRLSGSKLPIVK
ncbi:NUDIX hydrolase [Acidocella sp.]|uniref:NUDIX hydrolase n=1 Tax=Acidocella sp. TaxID=50710 RepID=UPI003CFF6873